MDSINALITETNNPATANISSCSTPEMVRLINAEDKKVALAVEQELPHIADAIDAAAARLSQGGRLFYVGAGTSGRLAVVDASECPCTYGVSPELVQAVLAGGLEAIGDAAQGDEDDADIYPIAGDGSIDLSDILESSFVLDFDVKSLCKEDCAGLCEHCGANLNEGRCSCKPQTDPRLAVLGQLLDDIQ